MPANSASDVPNLAWRLMLLAWILWCVALFLPATFWGNLVDFGGIAQDYKRPKDLDLAAGHHPVTTGFGCLVWSLYGMGFGVLSLLGIGNAFFLPQQNIATKITFFAIQLLAICFLIGPMCGNLLLCFSIYSLHTRRAFRRLSWKGLLVLGCIFITGEIAYFCGLGSMSGRGFQGPFPEWNGFLTGKGIPYGEQLNFRDATYYDGPLIGYFVWLTSIFLAGTGLLLVRRRKFRRTTVEDFCDDPSEQIPEPAP